MSTTTRLSKGNLSAIHCKVSPNVHPFLCLLFSVAISFKLSCKSLLYMMVAAQCRMGSICFSTLLIRFTKLLLHFLKPCIWQLAKCESSVWKVPFLSNKARCCLLATGWPRLCYPWCLYLVNYQVPSPNFLGDAFSMLNVAYFELR